MQISESMGGFGKKTSASSKQDAMTEKLSLMIDALGGISNITDATHCMTRLRLKIADQSKASEETLKSIKGVQGVVFAEGQIQIIIGVEVEKWHKALQAIMAGSGAAVSDEDKPKSER